MSSNSVCTASVVLCLATAVGCSWTRSLEFSSRDGKEKVEIYQPSTDPMLGLRVDYVTGSKHSTLLKAGETYIGFAHVYWPVGGSDFAVLICGTRPVRLAYDPGTGKDVPFGEIKKELDSDIVTKYGLDPGGSLPSECIGTYYQDQFRRLHPNLKH